MRRTKGFTLIELLATIIVLSIILAITVPTVTNIIENSKKSAFKEDARAILSIIRTKQLKNINYDVTMINIGNMATELNIGVSNYELVSVSLDGEDVVILLVGKNEWDGLEVYGTENELSVTNSVIATDSACFTFDTLTKTITEYNEATCTSDVVIPKVISNIIVRHIGESAFLNSGLTSATITNGILSIDSNAFKGNLLTTVAIPTSVTTVGDYAFSGNSLTSVTIDNTSGSVSLGTTPFDAVSPTYLR